MLEECHCQNGLLTGALAQFLPVPTLDKNRSPIKGPLAGLHRVVWQGSRASLEMATDSYPVPLHNGHPCRTPVVARTEASISLYRQSPEIPMFSEGAMKGALNLPIFRIPVFGILDFRIPVFGILDFDVLQVTLRKQPHWKPKKLNHGRILKRWLLCMPWLWFVLDLILGSQKSVRNHNHHYTSNLYCST